MPWTKRPKPMFRSIKLTTLRMILDMMYKPPELAEEIGVNVDTIYRSWMPAGMPYEIDDRGRYWIHGPAFVGWVKDGKDAATKDMMAPDQGWCTKCKARVQMKDPTIRPITRSLEMMASPCVTCGCTVNRLRKRQYEVKP
jgi:hypothetical protein